MMHKYIVQNGEVLDSDTEAEVIAFCEAIVVYELEQKIPLNVFYDSKSKAFYAECHITSGEFKKYADSDAVIDPENQEEYKLNRQMQPNNQDYKVMLIDAAKGRQFSDIVMEFNTEYKEELPLKILGGQHRTSAIIQESPQKSVHGIRIYFNLDKDTRAEIARVSNTNIAISPDLLDRMEEQRLEPPNYLRNFAHKIGFLPDGKDFGDKKTNEDNLPVVRLLRTFVVNFIHGKNHKGDFDNHALESYLCSSSGMDSEYEKLYRDFSKERDLVEAGKKFVALHKKQKKMISADPDMKSQKQFADKAVTPSVISAWSLVAGLLQADKDRLKKFYELPDKCGTSDPLRANVMSSFKMKEMDGATYRGLGTRQDSKERGRMVSLFLIYSLEDSSSKIEKKMIEKAVKFYHGNKLVANANKM